MQVGSVSHTDQDSPGIRGLDSSKLFERISNHLLVETAAKPLVGADYDCTQAAVADRGRFRNFPDSLAQDDGESHFNCSCIIGKGLNRLFMMTYAHRGEGLHGPDDGLQQFNGA